MLSIPTILTLPPTSTTTTTTTTGQGLRDSLLQQMGQLAKIIKFNMAPYLPALFELVQLFWGTHSDSLLFLVEEIAVACPDHFTPFVPQVIPLLLSSLTVQKTVFGGLENNDKDDDDDNTNTTTSNSGSSSSGGSRGVTIHVKMEGKPIDDDEGKSWLSGTIGKCTNVKWCGVVW